MKEADLQRRVLDKLKARGLKVIKIHGHMLQEASLPDVQVYPPKGGGPFVVIHIEFKGLDTPITLGQKLKIRDFASRNVPAFFLKLISIHPPVMAALNWNEEPYSRFSLIADAYDYVVEVGCNFNFMANGAT